MSVQSKPAVVVRLHPDVYAALERDLPKLGEPKNEHHAGMLIGIHLVLTKLRNELVVPQ